MTSAWVLLVTAVFGVAVAVLAMRTIITTTSHSETSSFPTHSFLSRFFSQHYNVSSFITAETITYDSNISLQELVRVHGHQPFVLTGASPASQWPALTLWKDSNYLKRQVPLLQRVTTVRNQFPYTYAIDKRPLPRLAGRTTNYQRAWWQHTRTTSMPFSEFLQRCREEHPTFYDYVQGWNHDFEKLSRDISPSSWMDLAGDDGKDQPPRRQVWMGCRQHAGSHAHYDHSHNLITQVIGTKRFILSPPSQWNQFRDAPRISRFVSFSQKNFSRKPLLPSSLKVQGSMEVVLHPGETLYLPPFWWHHVVALDKGMTIGTNIFVHDPRIQLRGLMKMPLPTEVHPEKKTVGHRDKNDEVGKSQERRIGSGRRERAAAETVIYLCQEILHDMNMTYRQFFQRIYENRYMNGEHMQQPPGICNEGSSATSSSCSIFSVVRSEEIGDGHGNGGIVPKNELVDLQLNQIAAFMKWRKNATLKYSTPSLDAVQMLLADYVEEIVSYAVGPTKVCLFLKCFMG